MDGRDCDSLRVARKGAEAVDVDGRDDGAAGEIADHDNERIDRKL